MTGRDDESDRVDVVDQDEAGTDVVGREEMAEEEIEGGGDGAEGRDEVIAEADVIDEVGILRRVVGRSPVTVMN